MEVGIYDENYDSKFLDQHFFNRLAFNSYPNVYENFTSIDDVNSYINVMLLVLILLLIYILYNTSKK